jgi:hypothetical protein
MRTKTLLAIAAVMAACVATSEAQVFSVNAVGYVTKTIPTNSFALISNPLRAATNTIDALFAGVPDGTQVFLFNTASGFQSGTFDSLDGSFGAIGQRELLPGQGAFVRNPSTTEPLQITFVGEVMQGNLETQMPAGFSIVSSQVPQAGTAAELQFPQVSDGDQVYKFNAATQTYQISTFDELDGAFSPPVTLEVGEAVFVRLNAARTWTRNFSVNP